MSLSEWTQWYRVDWRRDQRHKHEHALVDRILNENAGVGLNERIDHRSVPVYLPRNGIPALTLRRVDDAARRRLGIHVDRD